MKEIKPKKIKIIKDKKTGYPIGYGFLIFENYKQAKNALEILNLKSLPNSSNNKKFILNWAMTNKNIIENLNIFSIYIYGLETSVTEEKLTNIFKEKYKSVLNSKIIKDPCTKLNKGYGFVNFSQKNDFEKAMKEMDGKIINGKKIKTGIATYKKNDINDEKKDRFAIVQNKFLEDIYNLYGFSHTKKYLKMNPLYYQQFLFNQAWQKFYSNFSFEDFMDINCNEKQNDNQEYEKDDVKISPFIVDNNSYYENSSEKNRDDIEEFEC